MSQEVSAPARSHTPKGKAAREHILRACEPLFADDGFHGTSMRDVAEAADLPLASVVYHFAKKEKLYAAILGEIAASLLGDMERARAHADGESGLEAALRALVRWSLAHPGRVRLLVRELLDNPARVSRAMALPLAPVLTGLSAEVAVPNPETAVLHVVGAVSYVVAAWPTVKRMVGARREKELMRDYEEDAMTLARRVLGLPARRAKP
ncbi:MAG: TetR family transcriptional regulator [Labilithrix sp.]|nr:TetR family transcriptional regulator [Labilithrix sp.]MCW5816801.1 TetR family transcriptional regulator [Labilithrix sp.]